MAILSVLYIDFKSSGFLAIFFSKISVFIFKILPRNEGIEESTWKYSYKSPLISLSQVLSPHDMKKFDGNVINGPLFKYDNVQVFVNRLFLSRLMCH